MGTLSWSLLMLGWREELRREEAEAVCSTREYNR